MSEIDDLRAEVERLTREAIVHKHDLRLYDDQIEAVANREVRANARVARLEAAIREIVEYDIRKGPKSNNHAAAWWASMFERLRVIARAALEGK